MKKSLKDIKLSENLKKVYGFCGGGGSSCGDQSYGYYTGYTEYQGRYDQSRSCGLTSNHINGFSCSGTYISTRCGVGYSTTDYYY